MSPWTLPQTWTTGAVLSKADLDTHVRDNLLYLKTQIALEAAVELTLDTDGIITKTYSHHTVDTFEDAASDNLVTISGGAEGEVILLRAANAARTVVVKTGSGNIVNPGGTDVTLDDANDYCLLVHNGTNWIVVGGAAADELAAHVAAADPHTGYLKESDYDAYSILFATTDDTPVALTVNEQEVIGRLTGGTIDGIALGIADDNVVQIDDATVADDNFARFTPSGLEGLTVAEAVTALFGAALPENVTIQLDASISADEKFSGISELGTYGATIQAGELVYLASTGKWLKAKADSATTSTNKLGIALADGVDTGTGQILLIGKMWIQVPDVSVDYMHITNCSVTPATTWYAGTHSTDNGGNSGWIFTAP